MVNSTPAAEIEVDETLVRWLLLAQAPDLADRTIASFASGWDNAIFALGDDHLVRLPRRQAAVELVRNEQRWLPELAARLPLAIPVPVVAGRPSDDFAWPWSVVERIDGVDAIAQPPEPATAVEACASFFLAMHVPAPSDAPVNPYRGGPLDERDAQTHVRFDVLEPWLADRLDPERLRRAWRAALDAAPHDSEPVWIHGDVHPGNIIVRDGEIVSFVDFGDLTSGDRATDLGSAWMLFDEPERTALRELLAVDEATWQRARGWALSVSLAIAANSADNPRYEALSERTLCRIADEVA